jgi:hypothetical protein
MIIAVRSSLGFDPRGMVSALELVSPSTACTRTHWNASTNVDAAKGSANSVLLHLIGTVLAELR